MVRELLARGAAVKRRRVVLIVVEDEWIRGMVTAALREDARLTAHTVRSREVLLRTVTEAVVPDLIVVEVADAEGEVFVRQLRLAANRVPVVALVPEIDDARVDALRRAGCDAVVGLPPEGTDLLAVAQRLTLPS